MPYRRRSAAGITTAPRLPTRLGSAAAVRRGPAPAFFEGVALGRIALGFFVGGIPGSPGSEGRGIARLSEYRAMPFSSASGGWIKEGRAGSVDPAALRPARNDGPSKDSSTK